MSEIVLRNLPHMGSFAVFLAAAIIFLSRAFWLEESTRGLYVDSVSPVVVGA